MSSPGTSVDQEALGGHRAALGARPTVRGAEMRSARLLRALEMEDYAEVVALERTRRAQMTLPDQQPAISLTPDQHPVIMLPQREGQALPVTFVGGVDPPASIVVSPVVTQMLPPQALEEGCVGAPARRDVLGTDGHSDVPQLQDLWDTQEWGSQQDAILRMGAPSFVPASQGPINFQV